MGINIMLWKYIIKDPTESNYTYQVILSHNNNCERRRRSCTSDTLNQWSCILITVHMHSNKQHKLRFQSISSTEVTISVETV